MFKNLKQITIFQTLLLIAMVFLSVSNSWATIIETTYTYDANSNRMSETQKVDGALLKNLSYHYNSRSQLTAITDNVDDTNTIAYTYDANGNRTNQSYNSPSTLKTIDTQYTYNAKNQLVAVQEQGNILGQFSYDYQGMRLQKIGERGVENYVYDDQSVIYQTNGSDTLTAAFNYGPYQLLSITEKDDAPQYYLFDGLGSPITLTKSSGEVTARYTYDAFGNKILNTGNSFNRFAFTGHEEDTETDLIYMKARYYDKKIGQFLTQDNFEGFPDMPPSLNKYLYACSNPTYWRDPTGNYNEAGHFYTTYYVARAIGIGHDRAHKLAYFSQAPDQVGKFDAIGTQVDRAVSVLGKNNDDTRKEIKERRDGVHTQVHALTGGSAKEDTASALVKIKKIDKNDLSRLGVAIHLLADTYAHRKGSDSKATGDNPKLYKTGLGHLWQGKAPDQIHRRPELYKRYVIALATALASKEYPNNPIKEQEMVQKALVKADSFLENIKLIKENHTERKFVHKGWRKRIDNPTVSKETTDHIIEKITQQDYIAETAKGKRLAQPRKSKLVHGLTGKVEEDVNSFSNAIVDNNERNKFEDATQEIEDTLQDLE